MEEFLHQLLGSLSHYLQGVYMFLYIPGGLPDFLNHQQYPLSSQFGYFSTTKSLRQMLQLE